MNSRPYLDKFDGVARVDWRLSCRSDGSECKPCDSCSMVIGLVLSKIRSRDLRVPSDIDLLDSVDIGQFIKPPKESVEHVGHLLQPQSTTATKEAEKLTSTAFCMLQLRI
mmetsp:Transcript_23329/g.63033  ORF Transcript_23329/g.63033 Transcript_23329/m.63033 type:complete len:110 (+) Transcript_23329:263-592(+)